jgi:hypothetical protein
MKKILEDTRIVSGKVTLNGNLVISEGAQGIVLFAHGSGSSEPVIGMNETALQQLHGAKKLEIVPGATHLFEESGKLEEVAKLAAEWFVRYLK